MSNCRAHIFDRSELPHAVANTRENPRTNLFLAAVLQGGTLSSPVRIRNMSTVGALVECAVVPGQGSTVRLVRGKLEVTAEVAWAADGRCGLRFFSTVFVRDWLAPPLNQEQQRVDDVIRLVKAGAGALPPSGPTDPVATQNDSSQLDRLANDLRRACRLVEKLAYALADDPDIVELHGSKLQSLDIAVQSIEAVAVTLSGETGGPQTSGSFSTCPKAIGFKHLLRSNQSEPGSV